MRRLLFTRAPPSQQHSPKTPFDKVPETHGKEVSTGEVIQVLTLKYSSVPQGTALLSLNKQHSVGAQA